MEEWNNKSLEVWVDPHLAVVEEVLQDTTNLRPVSDSSSDDTCSSSSCQLPS